jgi:hypothetical protein
MATATPDTAPANDRARRVMGFLLLDVDQQEDGHAETTPTINKLRRSYNWRLTEMARDTCPSGQVWTARTGASWSLQELTGCVCRARLA